MERKLDAETRYEESSVLAVRWCPAPAQYWHCRGARMVPDAKCWQPFGEDGGEEGEGQEGSIGGEGF